MNLNKEWETGKMTHAEMPKVTLQDNGNTTSHPFLPSGHRFLSN